MQLTRTWLRSLVTRHTVTPAHQTPTSHSTVLTGNQVKSSQVAYYKQVSIAPLLYETIQANKKHIADIVTVKSSV